MPGCHNDELFARQLQQIYTEEHEQEQAQIQSNSNYARELQKEFTEEQIDSNYNMAKKLQEKYYRELDKDMPIIHKTEKLEKKRLEKKKVVSPEISFVKLFNELLPFLLFILLIVYLSTFMFSSTKTKGSKGRKK